MRHISFLVILSLTLITFSSSGSSSVNLASFPDLDDILKAHGETKTVGLETLRWIDFHKEQEDELTTHPVWKKAYLAKRKEGKFLTVEARDIVYDMSNATFTEEPPKIIFQHHLTSEEWVNEISYHVFPEEKPQEEWPMRRWRINKKIVSETLLPLIISIKLPEDFKIADTIPLNITFNSNEINQEERSRENSYLKSSDSSSVRNDDMVTLMKVIKNYKIPFEIPLELSGNIVMFIKNPLSFSFRFESYSIYDIFKEKPFAGFELNALNRSVVYKMKGIFEGPFNYLLIK